MSNRINNFDKVAPEIQSRLALVIVQGSIAPIRIVVIKNLEARLLLITGCNNKVTFKGK